MSNIAKKVTVYLNVKEHKELKVFCANLDISMSHFINLAIRDKIRNELLKNNYVELC